MLLAPNPHPESLWKESLELQLTSEPLVFRLNSLQYSPPHLPDLYLKRENSRYREMSVVYKVWEDHVNKVWVASAHKL